MLALHDANRFGDRGSIPRLVEVCQHVDGQLSEAIAAHAEALMAHDAMAIYAAAQRFEQLGALCRPPTALPRP